MRISKILFTCLFQGMKDVAKDKNSNKADSDLKAEFVKYGIEFKRKLIKIIYYCLQA